MQECLPPGIELAARTAVCLSTLRLISVKPHARRHSRECWCVYPPGPERGGKKRVWGEKKKRGGKEWGVRVAEKIINKKKRGEREATKNKSMAREGGAGGGGGIKVTNGEGGRKKGGGGEKKRRGGRKKKKDEA
jgi:hypothetical protein